MSDTGEIVPTEIEVQIEQAQVAGDTELAQRLYLKQQGVGTGDTGEPDDAVADQGDDAAEVSDIGPVPDGDWTFSRPEVVDYQFAMMENEFGELATDLKSEWGGDAGLNLDFALAASRQFEAHFPELVATVAERGASRDPLIVELLATLGRQWAETPGDPATVRLFPGSDSHEQEQEKQMSETNVGGFDEKVETLMNESEQAGDAGNLAKRDRLEGEIRALFVKKYGTGAIVGSSGGPTV